MPSHRASWFRSLDMRTRVKSALPRMVAVLAYGAALHWAYAALISPNYDYMGMTYRPPDPFAYAGIIVAVLVAAALMPPRITRVADFALWVIFLVTAAPSALLAQYMDTLPPGRATVLGLMVLLTLVLIRGGLAVVPSGLVKPRPLPPRYFFGALTVFACSIYVIMVATGSLSLGFLRFSDVYAVRADYKATLLTLPLMGYLVPALQSVVNPIFIAFGIHCRRWLPLAFGSVGQVLIYLASGQKIVLLFIGVAVGVALLFRRDEESASPVLVTWVFTALVAVTAVFDLITGALRLTPVFLQRFVLLPAALTGAYVWVFSEHPKLNFSTVLPFITTDYDEPVSPFMLVGQLFNNAEGNNANVNFFGDGYMQLGYAGMLIEGFVMLALLWAANEVTRHTPLPLACMVFLMPIIAITNGSAFTAILTLGFGVAVVLSFFLPTIESFPQRPSFPAQARAGARRVRALSRRQTREGSTQVHT